MRERKRENKREKSRKSEITVSVLFSMGCLGYACIIIIIFVQYGEVLGAK